MSASTDKLNKTIIFKIEHNKSFYYINAFCFLGNKLEHQDELIHTVAVKGAGILLNHALYLNDANTLDKILIGKNIHLTRNEIKQIFSSIWNEEIVQNADSYVSNPGSFTFGDTIICEFAIVLNFPPVSK